MMHISTSLAYIDPGAGALVAQSIAAAVLGAVFYFRKLLGKLFRKEHLNSDPGK